MQVSAFVLVALALSPAAQVSAVATNPVQKTLELLTDLATKITGEMQEAKTTFEELTKYCHHESKELKYEIKTSSEEIADLKAKIEKENADAAASESKITELSGDISKAEEDLKAATAMRETEAADFATADDELKETINTIERAIGILQSHASLLQSQQVKGLAEALTAMVQASAISSADATKLSAFVQTEEESDDSELGAPAATAYAGQSKGIVDVLEDLLEKAQSQLSDATHQEMEARHSYEMVKQSLEDKIKYSGKEMDDAKTDLATSQEAKASATADLGITEKDLQADKDGLANLESDCAAKTEDYNTATASREGELKAIAAAKGAISTKASGAESLTYDFQQTAAVSFLQESAYRVLSKKARQMARSPSLEVVRFVRNLARKQKSDVLALLASRMDTTMQSGAGADVFAKVKGLISEMIERLEKEASADATKKAYCDKETSESTAKKDEKTAEVEKLTTEIDTMSAKSAKLKQEVAELEKELADLAAAMAEADKLRQEEHAQYIKDKPEMEQGIEAVKYALKVLRDYYAEESTTAAKGAGEGVIGLLEVVESDFSKNLAEIVAAEEAAATAYDKTKKENEIMKVTKEQDVKYKTKEATDLDKAIAETTTDLEGVQAELDAVLTYLKKLEEQCVAKPETYADRTAQRAAEIAGLKEALSILENETAEVALVQKSTARRALRSIHIHAQ